MTLSEVECKRGTEAVGVYLYSMLARVIGKKHYHAVMRSTGLVTVSHGG